MLWSFLISLPYYS
jgi:hypothetical protein